MISYQMKKILQAVLGQKRYQSIERMKKRILPTKYDLGQQEFLAKQTRFYELFIRPGDLCFDIGANVGLKTGIFLKLGAKVVALEPQASCISILQDRFAGKATILQKGAGAKHEVKEFYIADNSVLSSFSKNWVNELADTRFSGNKVESVQKVEVVTLDSLIETYGTPQFIKIDVEGFEPEVMRGLSKPFRFLSFEYAVPEKKDEALASLVQLQKEYPQLKCNYAIGNENQLAMKEWIGIQEMIQQVQTEDFSKTFAGDIYVKSNLLN